MRYKLLFLVGIFFILSSFVSADVLELVDPPGNCGSVSIKVGVAINVTGEVVLNSVVKDSQLTCDTLKIFNRTATTWDSGALFTSSSLIGDNWSSINFTMYPHSQYDVLCDKSSSITRCYADGGWEITEGLMTGQEGMYISSDQRFGSANSYGIVKLEFTNVTVAPIGANESLESTIFNIQNGSQEINSPSFITVLSGTFNVSKNNTKAYLSVSNMVSASNSATAICRITLNGIDHNSSDTVDIPSGKTRNMYFTTDEINLLNETIYNAVFECSRPSVKYTVNNTVGVGHLLVNQNEQDVPYKFEKFSAVINDDSVWTLIDTYFFDINNVTSEGGDDVQKLVLDWSSSYENTGGSDNDFNMFFEIVDYKNCSQVPRTVLAGNTGPAGGNCLVNPINASDNVTIKVYGRGLDASFVGKVHMKNFFGGITESNSLSINTTVNINESFQLVSSMLVDNVNHDDANMFFKFSNSVTSNISTFCSGFSILRDGGFSQSSNIVSRSVSSNTGIANFQWVYNNVSKDNYSLDTYIKCDDKATLNFIGEPIIYMTDAFDIPKNSFTVTLKDNFDNGSIGGFNVRLDDDTVFSFSGTSGEVFVDINVNLTNMTITTDYNGGYFPATILNHNVSNDLFVSINQSIVFWDCVEKVSGVDLTCDQPLESTIFNYNTIGNPYTQSANVSGYLERLNVFNITPLFNGTKVSDMFSSNLSITVNSSFGTPFFCSFNITSLNHTFTEVVIGTPNSSIGLINGSYNVTADCIGFAEETKTIIINEVSESINFSLFTINSIFFRVFNISDGSLVTNLTEFTLKGSTLTVNDNTTTGLLFVDNLNDDTYTITVSSEGFTTTTLFATVSNNNTQNIDVFLKSGVSKSFIVVDNLGVFQDDVVLTFLQNINGTLLTIDQTKTDFSGRSTIFLDETVEYTFFASKSGFLTTTGDVVPTQSEYTVVIFEIDSDIPTSIFDDIKYNFPFSYIPNSTFAIANLTISSPSGSLEFFSINATYRSVFFNNTKDAFPNGGILSLNITNIDPNIENVVTVFYSFKSINSSVISWNTTYFLATVQGGNISITGGLFDDLVNLDKTNPIRGLFGFFLCIFLMIIFGIVTRETTPAILGFLIGLGINFRFDLLPKTLITVSLIVSVLLLIADNSGGRR